MKKDLTKAEVNGLKKIRNEDMNKLLTKLKLKDIGFNNEEEISVSHLCVSAEGVHSFDYAGSTIHLQPLEDWHMDVDEGTIYYGLILPGYIKIQVTKDGEKVIKAYPGRGAGILEARLTDRMLNEYRDAYPRFGGKISLSSKLANCFKDNPSMAQQMLEELGAEIENGSRKRKVRRENESTEDREAREKIEKIKEKLQKGEIKA